MAMYGRRLLSSPATHQNTELVLPLLLLLVTTPAEVLKESRGQYIPRRFSSHSLIPMTTQFNEFEAINNDQVLLTATGGLLLMPLQFFGGVQTVIAAKAVGIDLGNQGAGAFAMEL